jgi:2-polyprenyl-3-methyl-5-hydroxy-6-metoxy-1,4-benzoquinol methylase/uncharacterized protein YbaR (Trm112 family)
MRHRLAVLLRDPTSGERLDFVSFDRPASVNGEEGVREGILVNAADRRAFPVINGVPVMLPDAFPKEFLSRHRDAISTHPVLSTLAFKTTPSTDWSFSREWEEHFARGTDRTWGYTARERREQLLMETRTDASWFQGKVVLDGGCGNGALSQEIARLGATVVGLDFSSAVENPECHRQSPDVDFVRADLAAPPLAEAAFDLAFSIGVLHHTPDTSRTFRAMARLVKPGGRCYVWLYRRPERFVGRYLKVPVYDGLRALITRLPTSVQDTTVQVYARTVRRAHHLLGRGRNIPLREYVVSAYDDLTPRWRHYHTPFEVSRWFHEAGFAPPTLTHWDNPYGFGMMAERHPQPATPGVHYGAGQRLWDERTTILGRLHE